MYVKFLADSINYQVFVEFTCERSLIFYEHHLAQIFNKYIEVGEAKEEGEQSGYYVNNFPFK
jgi:hypothetical protein